MPKLSQNLPFARHCRRALVVLARLVMDFVMKAFEILFYALTGGLLLAALAVFGVVSFTVVSDSVMWLRRLFLKAKK